jgi:hypothetical protein
VEGARDARGAQRRRTRRGVEAASREALAAFGDGAVFIEPYLERGRHVEVQILGDRHGNVVHLGERECSIQRRNQKVVEESPSAGISDEVRATRSATAPSRWPGTSATKAPAPSSSWSAPSDGGATITFLEVNTRLQVEHPVTEAVTGLDLVELQLRRRRRRGAADHPGRCHDRRPRDRGARGRRGPGGRLDAVDRAHRAVPIGGEASIEPSASTPACATARRSRPTTTRWSRR